ncbi:hypothetical protein JCM10908_006353 [Rhodotorula pacifica]|uniref:uncharacterized protein n=1 Tax=Rhodotorula pacifica TaxID=1495444 RepID=UPI00316F9AA3
MRPSLVAFLAAFFLFACASPIVLEPRSHLPKVAIEAARRDALLSRLHNKHGHHHVKPKPLPDVASETHAAVDVVAPDCENPNPPPAPQPPQPQPPQPSNAPERRSLDKAVCPSSTVACPLSEDGYECVDTSNNLEQCGGCFATGGKDCTSMKGADAVGCIAGACEIWSCQKGYRLNGTGTACDWMGVIPGSNRA